MMPTTVRQSGFTLVELLIVIGIIGILAGVTLSIIEPDAQNDRAEDSVRLANLEKIVQGIEAYRVSEGSYPVDSNANGNPLDDANGLTTYMRVWPNGDPPQSTYEYGQGGGTFGVYVGISTGGFYKFHTTFNEIRVCPGTIDPNPNSVAC